MTAPEAPRVPAPHPNPRAWRNAVFAIFALSGMGIATWAARIPAIRSGLEIDTSTLGMLILGMSAGAILGLACSTTLLGRLGPRGGMLAGFILVSLGLALIGAGSLGSFAVVFAGLFLFGFGNGAVDVMMNLDGALVEAEIGSTLLPAMHAFFSVGTVIGGAIGAAAAYAEVPLVWHAGAVAALILLAGAAALRAIPDRPSSRAPASRAEARAGASTATAEHAGAGTLPETLGPLARFLAPWRDPRLLMIGLVILGMAFAEGSANDWLAQAVVDGYGADPATGAAVYTVFLAAMMISRFAGGPIVDRLGRPTALRACAALAILGLSLFIFSPTLWLAIAGAALWGLGCALGFPVGISAAADHPTDAEARVSAASMIGYLAFLAGPPLIGFLGQSLGLLLALVPVLLLVIVSFLTAGWTRPDAPRDLAL